MVLYLGITDVQGIVAAMKDPKRYDGPTRGNQGGRHAIPPQRKNRARKVGDNEIPVLSFYNILHCFGGYLEIC